MNLLNDLPDDLINLIYKNVFGKSLKFILFCGYRFEFGVDVKSYNRLYKYIIENKDHDSKLNFI